MLIFISSNDFLKLSGSPIAQRDKMFFMFIMSPKVLLVPEHKTSFLKFKSNTKSSLKDEGLFDRLDLVDMTMSDLFKQLIGSLSVPYGNIESDLPS